MDEGVFQGKVEEVMSDIDHTANLILNRNEDESVESRVNGYYVHLRHLKAMATLWLMRDAIADAIKANDDLLAIYAPPTDEMAYARQDNTNLLVELGRGDDICLPSIFGEALEKE